MTDVPFTALLILSVVGLLLGLDTGRDRLLQIGIAAAFAALFVRQLALAVFLAFLIASPLKLGFGRRWLFYAVSPTVLAGACLAIYSRVLIYFGRLPGMYYLKADSLNEVLRDLVHFRLGAIKPALRAAVMMFLLAGLFAPAFARRALALTGFRIRGRETQASSRLGRRVHVCFDCSPRGDGQLAAHVGEYHGRFADGDRLASRFGAVSCSESLLDSPHGCGGSRAVAPAPHSLRPFDGCDPPVE